MARRHKWLPQCSRGQRPRARIYVWRCIRCGLHRWAYRDHRHKRPHYRFDAPRQIADFVVHGRMISHTQWTRLSGDPGCVDSATPRARAERAMFRRITIGRMCTLLDSRLRGNYYARIR